MFQRESQLPSSNPLPESFIARIKILLIESKDILSIELQRATSPSLTWNRVWPNRSILTLLHSVSISCSLLFLSLSPFAGPLPSPFSCHALFPLSYLVAAKSAAFHFSFSCFWNSICTHSSCINERVCAVVYKLEPWNARCIIRHRPSKKI